eukprot:644672-Amphidinium_carterae.1
MGISDYMTRFRWESQRHQEPKGAPWEQGARDEDCTPRIYPDPSPIPRSQTNEKQAIWGQGFFGTLGLGMGGGGSSVLVKRTHSCSPQEGHSRTDRQQQLKTMAAASWTSIALLAANVDKMNNDNVPSHVIPLNNPTLLWCHSSLGTCMTMPDVLGASFCRRVNCAALSQDTCASSAAGSAVEELDVTITVTLETSRRHNVQQQLNDHICQRSSHTRNVEFLIAVAEATTTWKQWQVGCLYPRCSS